MKTDYENKQSRTVEAEQLVTHLVYVPGGLHRIPVGVQYQMFCSGTAVPEMHRVAEAKWGPGRLRRNGPFQWEWISKEADYAAPKPK